MAQSVGGLDEHGPENSNQNTSDMTAFVQNLLQQMQSRFQVMSDNIVAKIDYMGSRIDDLEKSINDLNAEVGAEGLPSSLTPGEAKTEEPASGSA